MVTRRGVPVSHIYGVPAKEFLRRMLGAVHDEDVLIEGFTFEETNEGIRVIPGIRAAIRFDGPPILVDTAYDVEAKEAQSHEVW